MSTIYKIPIGSLSNAKPCKQSEEVVGAVPGESDRSSLEDDEDTVKRQAIKISPAAPIASASLNRHDTHQAGVHEGKNTVDANGQREVLEAEVVESLDNDTELVTAVATEKRELNEHHSTLNIYSSNRVPQSRLPLTIQIDGQPGEQVLQNNYYSAPRAYLPNRQGSPRYGVSVTPLPDISTTRLPIQPATPLSSPQPANIDPRTQESVKYNANWFAKQTRFKDIHRYGPLLIKILRFSLVGILNTIVDIVVLNILLWISPTSDLWQILAYNSVACIVAACNSFLWNKYWTFKYRGPITHQLVLRFAAVSVVSMLGNNFILWVFIRLFPSTITGAGLGAILLKLAVGASMMALSFIGQVTLVFVSNKRESKKANSSSITHIPQ